MVFIEKIGDLNPYDGLTWEKTSLTSSVELVWFVGHIAGFDYDKNFSVG